MIIKCSISNAKIVTEDFISFNGLATIKTVHPIFLLSKQALLKNKNNLTNKNEKSIFLLALLNHYPTLFTLESCNIYNLDINIAESINTFIRHLETLEALTFKGYQLPHFIVNTESQQGLVTHLKTLLEVASERNQAIANKLAAKENNHLRRLTKLLNKADKALPSKLTKWLFSNVEFPKTIITGANRLTKRGTSFNHLDEYWEFVFKSLVESPNNCFQFNIADIEELYDFLLEHLENNNSNSILVFSTLNNAIKEYTALTVDILGTNNTLESEATKPNIQQDLINAPMPIKANYPTLMDYLLILAKWKLANPGVTV